MCAVATPPAEIPAAEERDLLHRACEQGDGDARRALIERSMPLVRSLARRYANRGEPLEDLEQVGYVGLIKAVDRFDPNYAVRFSTYAVPTVLGEIKRHFRDHAWSIRVSRSMQERSARAQRAGDRLASALGRPATADEVAAELGCAPDDVAEAIHAAQAYATVSLDSPERDQRDGLDRYGAEDPDFARAEQRIELGRALRCLPERERTIVVLRFYVGLTQREIAERVGISQMHVSRLLGRSLGDLADAIGVI